MAYTTINKSTLHMNTKTYSGTNSTNAQTGVGFKPDLSWIKDRGQNGHNHNLTDSVRGAPKILMSDSTTGENTSSASGRESTMLANLLEDKLDDMMEGYARGMNDFLYGDGTADADALVMAEMFA